MQRMYGSLFAYYLCVCFQIREANAEVNKLVEKRMMMSNPADDKLSLFRQQVRARAKYI